MPEFDQRYKTGLDPYIVWKTQLNLSKNGLMF